MKRLLFSLLLTLPGLSWGQTTLYGVGNFSSNLNVIDTATFLSSTVSMTSSLGIVAGANGLTADACGVTYIVYKIGSVRRLGTVNLTSGVITDIGAFTDNIANIAFDDAGLLYAVTGDGALASETLYSVNTTNAATTLISALGNGNDGEAIAFCPDNNKMYHWSGWGAGSCFMETVDLVTGATTTITTGVSGINNVGAAAYAGDGKFIISDINSGGTAFVDTNGVVSPAGSPLTMKGLTFATPSATVVNIMNITNATNNICTGDSVTLVCSNVSTSYEWFLNGTSTSVTNDTITVSVAGAYTCQIADPTCGFVSSSAITLNVIGAPNVAIVPGGTQTFCPGDSLQLFSTPGGSNTSQWYMNGSLISGATNVGYYVTTPGTYNVLKTNTTGCADSAAVGVMITMATSPNVVLTPSPNAIICGSGSVSLSVNTGGGTIQWTNNGVNIPGATFNNYTANTVGVYNVIKTNMSFCSDSSAVGTTVTQGNLPNVTITPSPTVQFCSPGTTTLTVDAGGGSRQWYKDGVLIPGETGMTFDASSEGSYNVIKTNSDGCTDSSAVATFADDTCALSLSEIDYTLEFTLYPNPSTGNVTLDIGTVNPSEIQSIKVLGIDGKTIIDIKNVTESELFMDLSNVVSGTYLIRIQTSKGTSVKELIVQ